MTRLRVSAVLLVAVVAGAVGWCLAGDDAKPIELEAKVATWIAAPPWPAHAIDDRGLGADGVRSADFDGDGRPDLVVPWEESGEVRLCFHPGAAEAAERWPCVVVGRVGSPEDAVPFDLDGDGALDVVVASEGATRTVFALRRAIGADPRRESAWTTEAFPATVGVAGWLVVAPLVLDPRSGPELLIGGRSMGAQVARLAPEGPRAALDRWRLERIRAAAWVMSMEVVEDASSGIQLLVSDRGGERSGVWRILPNGEVSAESWPETQLAAGDGTPFFFDLERQRGYDGIRLALAYPPSSVRLLELVRGQVLSSERIDLPDGVGEPKAVRFVDLDLDGRVDLAVSCEHAINPRRGVVWLRRTAAGWQVRDVSGRRGAKFDRIEPLDIDGDGDLDLVTTEETKLGAIWYENPARRQSP